MNYNAIYRFLGILVPTALVLPPLSVKLFAKNILMPASALANIFNFSHMAPFVIAFGIAMGILTILTIAVIGSKIKN